MKGTFPDIFLHQNPSHLYQCNHYILVYRILQDTFHKHFDQSYR